MQNCKENGCNGDCKENNIVFYLRCVKCRPNRMKDHKYASITSMQENIEEIEFCF